MLPRPENPHKTQPVLASPQGCSLWQGTHRLGCCSLPSAFCLSGYKSPCMKPAKKSNSQQCEREEGCVESLFCPSQQFCVPGGCRRSLLGVQGPLAAEPTCSCPAASPLHCKGGSQGKSWTKAIPRSLNGNSWKCPGVTFAVPAGHWCSVAPLQLGHVPAWAGKSCPPLPVPVFGL